MKKQVDASSYTTSRGTTAAPGLSGQVSFFVVAISPSQPLDTDLRHARTFDLEGHAPPDILVAHPDGRLANRDKDLATAQTYTHFQYLVANLLQRPLARLFFDEKCSTSDL